MLEKKGISARLMVQEKAGKHRLHGIWKTGENKFEKNRIIAKTAEGNL